jgi:hypothetical protein
MADKPRLRVFERSDGYRFVKQMTQAEVDAYLAENTDLTLIR